MAFNLRNRSFVKLLDFTPQEILFLLEPSTAATSNPASGARTSP
jgi:hypothetical protein